MITKSSLLSKIITLLLLTSPSIVLGAGQGNAAPHSDTLIFSLLILTTIVFLMIIYVQINAAKSILDNKQLWTGQGNSSAKIKGGAAVILLALLLSGPDTYAGNGGSESIITLTKTAYWTLISLNAFLLGIIITLHFTINGLIKALHGEKEVSKNEKDVLAQLATSLTGSIPIEKESEIMLDHNYDGIRELDNNLPPWWVYGFYITILFSGIYLVRFHITGNGDLQLEEYNKELAEAEVQKMAFMAKQANLVDESSLEALTDETKLEAGKKVFQDNCRICHGQFGEGLVGPNLTDNYWKNGGGIKGIYHTIKTGVPDKGMIPWEGQLTPGQIHEVASFIVSLEGSNPPNAKGPEGELFEIENAATDTSVQQHDVPTTPVEKKI